MKHPLKISLIVIVMFLLAQLIGLAIIGSYDRYFGKSAQEAVERGELVQPEVSVVKETVPPEVELKKPVDAAKIVVTIVIAILVVTAIFFLLSYIKVTIVFKAWFAFVVFICLSIAFTLVLYPHLSASLFNVFGKKVALAELIAVPLAAFFTFFKIVKRNIIAHNFTELFIYPGLSVVFLPLFAYSKFGILTAIMLLIVISIYDMIAVWKTKYMIRLAKFQIEHLKLFAGFYLPLISPKDRVKIQKMRAVAKRKEKATATKRKKKVEGKKAKERKKKLKQIKVRVNVAALGGGDVAFPLIFAGTILFAYGLAASIITVLCTTLALTLLLIKGEKGKFYPAMPFLSAGCFLGLIIVLLF